MSLQQLQWRHGSVLILHKEVEVGPGELLMDGLQQVVPLLASCSPFLSLAPFSDPSDGRGWLVLRGVGEAEGGAVNEAVQSDERQRDGDHPPQTTPPTGEGRDVRDNADQRLRRPEETTQQRSWDTLKLADYDEIFYRLNKVTFPVCSLLF